MIFPVLALLKYRFLVAVLAAVLLLGISLLILYTAEYKVVPITRKRGGKTTS